MNVGKSLNHLRQDSKSAWLILFALFLSLYVGQLQAGAACVVAKRLGDSLAIEWIASSQESVTGAVAKATRKLVDQGYRIKGQDVHAQASTEWPHAHMVIIKTHYITLTGRSRASYGCGYSLNSAAEAEQRALYDLRNYSWGWKPELGYEVLEVIQY
jgi:hypothetical protein